MKSNFYKLLAGSMAGATLLVAGVASAQTSTYPTTTPAPGTPAPGGQYPTTSPVVPNTGTGGDVATTLAILTVSGIAIAGGAYLLRRRATQ